MKRTISVLACLALLATSHLVANNLVTTIDKKDHLLSAHTEDPKYSKNPDAEKSLILRIPNVQLSLKHDAKNEVLKVQLEGKISDKLDWVIFQPKGAVLSRITTNSVINEIKTDQLANGLYVLMIKDSEGRAIFKSFTKD